MQKNIPEIGKLYAADDYNLLGREFDIGGNVYKFVFVPSGNGWRKNSALYVDSENYCKQVLNATWLQNAFAVDHVDAIGSSCYTLVRLSGYGISVDIPDNPTLNNVNVLHSCVFERVKMVNYINGQMRCANSIYNVAPTSALETATCAATAVVTFGWNTDGVGTNTPWNLGGLPEAIGVGDIVKWAVGGSASSLAVVASVNTSVLQVVSGASAGFTVTSCSVRVVEAEGLKSKSQAWCVCANAIPTSVNWYNHQQANTSNKVFYSGPGNSTYVYTNAAIVGTFIKNGDRITMASQATYSTLATVRVINTACFQVNAAVSVAIGSGNFGVDANVNNYTAKVVAYRG